MCALLFCTRSPTNYIAKSILILQFLELPGHSCLILLPIWCNYSRKRITKLKKYEMGVKIPAELIKYAVKCAMPNSGPGCGPALPAHHGTYLSKFLTGNLMTEKSTIIMVSGSTHGSNFPLSSLSKTNRHLTSTYFSAVHCVGYLQPYTLHFSVSHFFNWCSVLLSRPTNAQHIYK